MAIWCLPSHLADKFLEMIRKGTISPETMLDMTSSERHSFFATHFGEENASRMNAELEKKLILKNQQAGMVTWAKHISGLSPKVQRDMVSRIEKLTDILTPESEDAFLEDLAAQALGVSVSMEEAGNIASLAKETRLRKDVMESSPRRKPNERATKTELDYGRALIAFDNYMTTLKLASEGFISERVQEKLRDYKENPFRVLKDGLKFIAETSREIRTSLDNSYIGRQGRNLFFKGMTGDFVAGQAWWKTFKDSHRVLWETLQGRGAKIMDELNAEIVSSPNYDLMRRARIATHVVEEETPAEWFSDLPFLGRPFAASHNAFTASAHMLRYRTGEYYLEKARQLGTDLNDQEQLEGIGSLVNALTGRGEFGKRVGDKPGILNNVFFSPRLLKADFDTLTAHVFDINATPFVRKEAAKNLMRIIVGQAIILAVASLIDDDSVEWDPRSADFAKIRVGNTRFDVGAGMGTLTRLAARLAPLILNQDAKIKNSKGQLVKINTGEYGKRTGLDIFEDFLENKAAPLMSVFMAHLEGHYRFTEEKPTALKDIRELYLPLSIDNLRELRDTEESANMLTAALADAYGVFTQTYEPPTSMKRKPGYIRRTR